MMSTQNCHKNDCFCLDSFSHSQIDYFLCQSFTLPFNVIFFNLNSSLSQSKSKKWNKNRFFSVAILQFLCDDGWRNEEFINKRKSSASQNSLTSSSLCHNLYEWIGIDFPLWTFSLRSWWWRLRLHDDGDEERFIWKSNLIISTKCTLSLCLWWWRMEKTSTAVKWFFHLFYIYYLFIQFQSRKKIVYFSLSYWFEMKTSESLWNINMKKVCSLLFGFGSGQIFVVFRVFISFVYFHIDRQTTIKCFHSFNSIFSARVSWTICTVFF